VNDLSLEGSTFVIGRSTDDAGQAMGDADMPTCCFGGEAFPASLRDIHQFNLLTANEPASKANFGVLAPTNRAAPLPITGSAQQTFDGQSEPQHDDCQCSP